MPTRDKAAHVPMPDRIKSLPFDERRGFIVPWFVAWPEGQGVGEPEFRAMDPAKFKRAVQSQLCWVCGKSLGRYVAFTIGPMCAVNRISAEPPSHKECSIYSACACPFLSRPHARRRPLEEGVGESAGIMLGRNPGVTLVWVTKGPRRPFRASNGYLFKIGEPEETIWFCRGRAATREEVLESIDTGYPALLKLAEEEGPAAVRELEGMRDKALELVPA